MKHLALIALLLTACEPIPVAVPIVPAIAGGTEFPPAPHTFTELLAKFPQP